MIVEWFLGWTMSVVQWLVGLLPDWIMPPEIAAPGGLLSAVMGNAAGVGIWLDWGGLIALALIPFGVWATGIIWKSFRTGFSHFPGIGGSG